MLDLRARDRRLFLIVVLCALAIRVAYLVDVHDTVYLKYPLLDSAWYDAKAKDVLAGDLLARTGSFRVPLYIYFLAGMYALFGHSFAAVAAVQMAIGAVSCGLVFLIGKRLFGALAGAVGGFAFAFYRMAIYSDGEILPTTLFLFFTLLAVLFLLKSLASRGAADPLLAGLFLGLAYLTRPEVLLFSAGLAIALAALEKKRAFRPLVLMGIVLAMTMSAMALRNRAIFGQTFLSSPQGAVNLYVGNARYSDGKSPVAPPTRFPYGITADPTEDTMVVGCEQAARERTGRDLNDRELGAYYTRQTFVEIGAGFPRWLGLLGRKAAYFMNSYEISDIKYLPRYIEKYSRVLRLPLVNYALVMPIGFVGLWLVAAKKLRPGWIVVSAFLGAAATCIIFFVVWRFRLPAVPFLAILGGLAVREWVAAWRGRAWRTFACLAIPAVLLGALSLPPFFGIKNDEHVATYISNEAVLYSQAGETEKAIEVYTEAIEADPRDARAYYYVGKAYASLGRLDEARGMLENAMYLNPNYTPFALLSIGVAFAGAGRFPEASEYFGRAVKADPGLAIGYYDYGYSLYKTGRLAEAEAALDQAVARANGDPNVMIEAARTLIEMGRVDKGVALAQAVLAGRPRDGHAYFVLGLGLKSQGRFGEAVTQFEKGLAYGLPAAEAQEARQEIADINAREPKR